MTICLEGPRGRSTVLVDVPDGTKCYRRPVLQPLASIMVDPERSLPVPMSVQEFWPTDEYLWGLNERGVWAIPVWRTKP